MKLLALHTSGHDTGLCLFEDGRLQFAVETERLTRIRHQGSVDVALEHLWTRGGATPDEIDLVVFSTNVRKSFACIERFEEMEGRLGPGELAVEGRCSLLGRTTPCLVVAHEASHAALACHYAGWREPLVILVNEGRGTFSRNSCFLLRGGRLSLIDADSLPWFATGFGWSALSYLLGFGPSPSAAGTAMAMGGYGRHSDAAEAVLRSIDPVFHHSGREQQRGQAQSLIDFIAANPEFANRADLVHTFQALFTDEVIAFVQRQLRAHGGRDAALSGGCALNLHTNSALRAALGTEVAVPPNCNDAGQPLGAALYAQMFHLGIRPEPYAVDRCGVPLDADEAVAAARQFGLRVVPYSPERLAAQMANGATVALSQGASELGPRALGNRSLLAASTCSGARRRLSEELKQRQWFRPLAGVMREETFRRSFPGALLSPYMLFQYAMPNGAAPEITHADGTCRIQTLARAANPRLYELLEVHERRNGEIALINTSLNAHGKSIAYAPRDVFADFPPPAVDAYVFDDIMAVRDGAPSAR